MIRYIYPAVFCEEDNGQYSVYFPDFESCYTCGDSLKEAYEMAVEVLSSAIYMHKEQGKELPVATHPNKVLIVNNKMFVSLVGCGYYV